MQTFLAVLGVVYAAVFIWLTIRIVNRPKAWRTWIGVAVPFAVAPLLGMVCLISMDSNCPSDDHAGAGESSTMTNYVAIVGPETVWPGAGATARGDIQDGAANTLMVVEVANSGIHWMEPRDLHVSQMAPSVNAKSGQGISSRHTGGANVLIADGAVRFIPNHLSADELRAWLTAHAGDITQEF